MGAALGVALVLPPAAAIAVFAGLGFGLALPFLLLGFIPALRRRLPRPGPWMERFRHIMAVPMFATALGLAWILGRLAGVNAMTLGLAAALIVALALWWVGRRQANGLGRAWLPLAPAVVALGLMGVVAAQPAAAALTTEPFSEARLAALQAEKRPVFVYFTADWCLTCKVNEKAAIDRGEVAAAFQRNKVAVLVGDWTSGDAAITRFLAARGPIGCAVLPVLSRRRRAAGIAAGAHPRPAGRAGRGQDGGVSDVVGRVVALNRFPVKSMAGEALDEAELRWRGISGDRQYAFLRSGNSSRFPWFTGRDQSDLICYRARFRDPDDPKGSAVEVVAPDGAVFALDASELQERFGEPVELVQLGRGAFDAMPVSIVTTATLAALGEARGGEVDVRRFRINIVVESEARENAWAGQLVEIGGTRLLAHDPIERCVMITIDPDTGVRSPGLMKTVVRGFDNWVGLYASPARLGTIRVGDDVHLI